jgi:hypothetical protein
MANVRMCKLRGTDNVQITNADVQIEWNGIGVFIICCQHEPLPYQIHPAIIITTGVKQSWENIDLRACGVKVIDK